MIYKEAPRSITPPQRGKAVEQLLQDAALGIEGSDDDPLYQAALAVEQDEELAAEMAEWEEATIGDGIVDDFDKKRP
jgi:hypothetical protein